MPRLMPVKAEAVASVMMKPLMPVRTVSTPLISPPSAPIRRASGTARIERHAEHLQHAAERDGDEPAERADGDVHLPDAERHHLREADEERDAEAPQHHVDVELGQEVRGEHGEHRAADEDRREQARPFDEEEAAKHGQRCLIERRAA